MEQKMRKPGEVIFAAAFIVLGFIAYYETLGMTGGTPSSPSVFPKLASLVLAVMAVIVLLGTLKHKPPEINGILEKIKATARYLFTADIVFMLVMLFVYSLILERLHFIAASLLFIWLSMVYLKRGGWVNNLLIAAGNIAVIVLIFKYIFRLLLP